MNIAAVMGLSKSKRSEMKRIEAGQIATKRYKAAIINHNKEYSSLNPRLLTNSSTEINAPKATIMESTFISDISFSPKALIAYCSSIPFGDKWPSGSSNFDFLSSLNNVINIESIILNP